MRRFIFPITVISFLSLLLIVSLSPIQALAGPAAAAEPAEFDVVASGLNNPRGMVFGADDALYIAEAGTGGDGACITGPEGEACYGTTGVVTQVIFDSVGQPVYQTQVVTGLSSLGAKDTGNNAIGAHDVAFTSGGDMYVIMGLGADPASRDPNGPLGAAGINFGQLVAVDSEWNWSNAVDIAEYETANNPDGAQVDSNPFALLADGDTFKVVDAGANDLLSVANFDGDTLNALTADISTVGIFLAQMVEFPPGSGEMVPMDAVPTAVEIGPDGAYYVSQLTGFPFPVGGANIWRVVPGEDPEVYLTGFTNVLDLAFGPDGSLYVLEMAKDSLLADPPPVGQIIQVAPYGARTVIASDGLVAPVDMEIGPDYALYVTNFGPIAGAGQVVRIPLPSTKITLDAAKDNTLYESETGSVSNGSGQSFFAGKTNNGKIRRGLVGFDVASAVPVGSKIVSAQLELHMSKSIAEGTDVTLHPYLQDWGEGTSDADGEEGAGAKAAPGDATWLHTFYDTDTWNNPGGDFKPNPSATTNVSGVGTYQWSSLIMAQDLQSCLDAENSSCGWLVMGDEGQNGTAKRFSSSENPEEDERPKLVLKYVTPLPENALFLPVTAKAD